MSTLRSKRTQKKRARDACILKSEPLGRRKQALAGKRSRLQTWAFRIVGLTIIPALLLGLTELGLRVVGYGYSPDFFKKFTIGGQVALVENDQFGLRFFPRSLVRIPAPVVMKAAKAPKSYRIFAFGESAALGDPRPNYGASRYLEALLRERYPGRDFEVVNTSMTAINSHAILPIARECARYQGDFWILYMGNNEMVGPYGAASVAGARAPPRWLIKASLEIQRLRAGQLLMECSRRLFKGPATASEWRGMEMFLQNQLPLGDPRKEVVYQNFRRNLDDILRAGVSSGAKILLSTIAVNLKDCPPFASSPLVTASTAEGDAREALQKGDQEKAKKLYAEVARRFPDSADAQFQLGTCCLRLGETSAAEQHLQSAVDLDALPFRADSLINATIKEAADRLASQGVSLCDAAAILNSNSPGGIAGQECFYEHVHLNFNGNYMLGLAWAREIEKLMPAEISRSGLKNWASAETCERRLALTDWNRLSTLEEVVRRLDRPPLSRQLNNSVRVQEFQTRIDNLNRRILSPDEDPLARALYLEATASRPADACLHENFAEFLEAIHDRAGMALEWERTRDLIPHYYLPHYNLGVALETEGKLAQARDSLEEAARLNGSNGDIRLEIGVTFAREGLWETALQHFAQAHQLDPENPRELLYSGEMLWKLKRREQSMRVLRDAIHLRRDYWQAHYRLGDELALSGQIEAAATEFRETLRTNPGYVKAHENLGVALYKLGRSEEAIREFDETLRLDPQNQTATGFKRQAQNQIRN
jgi:tetratricopeptide (TPR) repeat protein